MIKQSVLLVIITGWFAIVSFSQEKVFSRSYEGFSNERLTSRVIENEEKDFFIISLTTDRLIKRYYVSKSQTSPLLEQHIKFVEKDTGFMYYGIMSEKFIVDYRRLIFAGGVYRNKKLIEVMRSRVNADMYFYETDLAKGTTIITDTVKVRRNETVIHCFDKNDELTLVTYVDGTNTMNIYKKKGSVLKKTELKIVLPGENGNNDYEHIFSKRHFSVYQNNQRYHVIFTLPSDKAFIQKDKLFLTLTEKDADVYTITLNLDNPGYIVKKFSPVKEVNRRKVAGSSAFLIDSLLITSYANEGKIFLDIFDMNTGQELSSKEINESNIEQFIVEPIQRTGSFLSKSDMKEEGFKKFYATVKNNDLSVSAYSEEGKLFLSFGSQYKQVINGTTLLNIFLTAAGTYFINSSPDYYGYFISGFQGVRNATYTSFDATLNKKDFSPVSAGPNFTIWERLSSFTNLRRLNLSYCNFFYMNGYYYIGYFETGSWEYVVTRFNEKGVE